MPTSLRCAGYAPSLALLLLSSSLIAQERAAVGDVLPDYEFKQLVQHDGRTRLSELRGQPVIVAGFKQHLVEGLDAAWVAKDLLHKHESDGLLVVLEDQMAWKKSDSWARVLGFWMRFFGHPVWITSNFGDGHEDLPIQRKRSQRDVRSLVLIGVDGRLVLEGVAEPAKNAEKSSDFRVAFRRAVHAELEKRKKGWGPTKTARRVRALAYGKGELAKANAAIAKAGGDEAELSKELRATLVNELDAAFAARAKRVDFLLAEGRYVTAKAVLKKLRSNVRGVERWEKRLEGERAALASKAGKLGQRLDRKLIKVLKPIYDRKFGRFAPKDILAVREFAKKHAATRVGVRAKRLDDLLVHIVSATKGMRITKLRDELARKSKE